MNRRAFFALFAAPLLMPKLYAGRDMARDLIWEQRQFIGPWAFTYRPPATIKAWERLMEARAKLAERELR